MKNYQRIKVLKKPRAIVISQENEFPGEKKLIFKRLRPPPPHWREWGRWLGGALKTAFLSYVNLVRPRENLRIISPDKPPVPEHEWNKPNILRPRI